MPELPEVEHIRRTLAARIEGLTVGGVRVAREDVIRTEVPRRRLGTALLRGGVIRGLSRHGKRMAIEVDDGRAVEFGLGMSGQFILEDAGRRAGPQKHRHVTWSLKGFPGSPSLRLVWRDPRRFGGLMPFSSGLEMHRSWERRYGPDALVITAVHLHRHLTRTRRNVKTALLDQKVLAGVGNIYADEALFRSHIHPEMRGCDLELHQTRALQKEIRKILRQAIRMGGSTIRDHQDPLDQPGGYQASHAVYGRQGEPCVACREAIRKTTLNGRGTHWCPSCQQLP